MKNYFFTLLFILSALTTLTSCHKKEEVKTISPKEQAAALKTMVGNYTGAIEYSTNEPDKTTNYPYKIDTVRNVNWSVNDASVLTIEKMPVKSLSTFIVDENLRNAIAKAEPQPLECKMYIFEKAPVQFYISDIKPQMYSLNYGGKEHKVIVTFNSNTYLSMGVYDFKEPTYFYAHLMTDILYVDGEPYTNIKYSNSISLTTNPTGKILPLKEIFNKYE